MLRWASLGLLAMLAGCDMIGNAIRPLHERINEAHPLPTQTEVARRQWEASIETLEKEIRDTLTTQLARMLETRALTCSAAVDIGFWDSPKDIKTKVNDKRCLADQDLLINTWLALQRAALLAKEPVLVPMQRITESLAVPNSDTGGRPAFATLATSANVLAVTAQDRTHRIYALPRFKLLSEIKPLGAQNRRPWLSPNGRLLATPIEKGLNLYDIETGDLIWSTTDYVQIIAWNPVVESFSLIKSGQPELIALDIRSGRPESYQISKQEIEWAFSNKKGQIFAGNRGSITLLETDRDQTTGTLDLAVKQRWSVPQGLQGEPLLMKDDALLLYENQAGVGSIDLKTNQREFWRMEPAKTTGMAKINETEIVFNATSDLQIFGRHKFNIENHLVSACSLCEDRGGYIQKLGIRPGYAYVVGPNAEIGFVLPTSEPKTVEAFSADANLLLQLRRLDRLSAMQEAAEARKLATQSAIKDVSPLRTTLSPAAEVAAIGVYQAKPRTPGVIRVKVLPGNTPLVLVLSSYESVQWQIEKGNRVIQAILLSGYTPSTVTGHGAIEVARIGTESAYTPSSPGFAKLKEDVERITKRPLKYFQGLYHGTEFEIK